MARLKISARNGLIKKKPNDKFIICFLILNISLSIAILLRVYGIV
jgi:hypothetical protein